ncbi:MAG: DUF4038 domain-containing protein [Theionarchaea archaeon]|nr:DUF4038 domain-containing protein [Theionarchaea archaeon]
MVRKIHAVQMEAMEWSFQSGKSYEDPFNDVTLDVAIIGDGGEFRVPTYWAGGNEWRIRFAPPVPGDYTFSTVCSDAENADLHGVEGELSASPYSGGNPLLEHGFVGISEDGRHFEHADGTPFLWLGDTWWMGLCKRLRWPDDFQLLTADRVEHGFTVIQIIAGLYPDMPAFDERGANEAGYPWETDYSRINPAYFDMADLKIRWLVNSGLAPCIVGCWGYFLPWMGVEKLKQHWRNIIARWGSYPVFWCLAGEVRMAYYLSKTKEEDGNQQRAGWTDIARYVREIDPYRHPVTAHPGPDLGRDQLEDPALLDFDMLQTGHGDRKSAANHRNRINEARNREPVMPVLVGEVSYEGILEAARSEIQRYMFWSAMLSGTAGHTYGANGIWQLNQRGKPFGPSPHGSSWGDTPWEDAYRLPGSRHLGLGKRILESYRWWEFEPKPPEWVNPHYPEEAELKPHAAGIPGEVWVVYIPNSREIEIQELSTDGRWMGTYIDPKNGNEYPIGEVEPNEEGMWKMPRPHIFQDWILILKNEK